MISKEDARSLAVTYSAWVSAKDDLDVVAWGSCLLELQRKLGITMVDPDNTRKLITFARDRRNAAEGRE